MWHGGKVATRMQHTQTTLKVNRMKAFLKKKQNSITNDKKLFGNVSKSMP